MTLCKIEKLSISFLKKYAKMSLNTAYMTSRNLYIDVYDPYVEGESRHVRPHRQVCLSASILEVPGEPPPPLGLLLDGRRGPCKIEKSPGWQPAKPNIDKLEV